VVVRGPWDLMLVELPALVIAVSTPGILSVWSSCTR